MRGEQSSDRCPPDIRSSDQDRLMAGIITRVFRGQGFGAIRTADVHAVYFHRTDVMDGSWHDKMRVGDAVTFLLVEDALSGPRAEQVRRRVDEDGRGAA
jgi:cold shock CspA family protein